MRRRQYGTRFTTGCGHSWRKRYPKWTIRQLAGATTDCKVCGELLIIPPEQFTDSHSMQFPFNVHMPRFHLWMWKETNGQWPADGNGTGYVEFEVASEES
jgi:hypothetical protein